MLWLEKVDLCSFKECGHEGNKLVSKYCSYKRGFIFSFNYLYLRADSVEPKCFVANYERYTKSFLERASSESNYALYKFRS
jgi:hypothetical protein